MSSLVLVSSLQTRKLKSGPEYGFYKSDGRRYDYGFRILNSQVSVAGGGEVVQGTSKRLSRS